MKKVKFLKALIALGVVAACGCMLAACSGGSQSSGGAAVPVANATGGVAATVDGTEIPEDDITNDIQMARESYDLIEDSAWGEFLVTNEMTPEAIRSDFIEQRINEALTKKGIEELGLTVESSEVDEYVKSMRENFESDEDWEEALEQAGFTEESYRKSLEESLLDQKLSEHFETTVEVTDADMLETASTIAQYYNGAKRSSYILFAVEDVEDEAAVSAAKESAQAALDQINGGADFVEVGKQSADGGTATFNEDAGWDVTNYIGEEYATALDELDKDAVSGLVEGEDGVYIIKCTDVFTTPDKITDLKQIPEDFRDSITDMTKSDKVQSAQSEWLEGIRKNAEIVINDMPANVPYNIDLTPYKEAAADEAGADGDVVVEDGETADGEEVEVVPEGEGAADDDSVVEEELLVEEAEESEASSK